MKAILLSFIVLLPLLSFSQKIKKERPAPQWDTLYFKNEISLDVSPVIDFLVGDIKGKPSFGITYRRFFDKNDAIRLSTRHGIDNYSSTTDQFYKGDPLTFNYTPSALLRVGDTVLQSTYRQTNYYSPDIRIGYEHRFGKRRFKCMLGLDAIIGIERIKNYEENNYHVLQAFTDSLGTRYYLSPTGSPFSQFSQPINTTLKVGLSPFVGVQVHLSKRFSLNASTMFDLFWSIPISNNTGGLNLMGDAILADIGLTVHF